MEILEWNNKVYGIFNKDKSIIYIGITKQLLEERFYQHKTSYHCRKINEYLNRDYACYIGLVSIHKSEVDMKAEEKRLIKKYKPLCNIVCNNDIPYKDNRKSFYERQKIDVNDYNKYIIKL